jgi:hypothetical protein
MNVITTLLLCFLLHLPTVISENPAVQNSKATQETRKSAQPSPSVSPILASPTPLGQPRATNEESNHKGEAKSGTNTNETVSKPLDWPYLAYLAITALIAYFTFRTLGAVQRQGDLMQGQLTEMQRAREQTIAEMKNAALQSDRLIRQAEVSADAAKKSAEALVNIERPWIVVTIHDGVNERYRENVDGTTDQTVYFQWSVTNYGKTAALVYETVAILEVKTIDEVNELRTTDPDGKPRIRPDAFIVGPGQCHECVSITTTAKHWTPAARSAVYKREALLVAHGLIKYKNTIGSVQIHQTPFLGVYVFADTFDSGTFRRHYDASGYNKYT